jgi:hypothetical protein
LLIENVKQGTLSINQYNTSMFLKLAGIVILKISWISLLATGIGVLGFGIIVAVYTQIAGPTEEGLLLQAIGIATTGMGIFEVMIMLMVLSLFCATCAISLLR